MAGFPWGGSEELWTAAALEAVSQGHKVAASVYDWPVIASKIVSLGNNGIIVYKRPLPPKHGDKLTRIKKKAISYFRNSYTDLADIRRFNPSVICICQGGTYDFLWTNSIIPFIKKIGVPYVVICQISYDQSKPSESEREYAIQYFSHANNVLFVAEHNLRTTERQLASKIKLSSIIKNPVNLSNLEAVPFPILSKKVKMACVARLDINFKGQDVLIEVLSKKKWLKRNWELSLYGEGFHQQYLEKLIEYYGLQDRVKLFGFQTDVKSIWLNNHILILPSRAEGTPLAMVEAMICGRPSIVTDVGGNTEWISEPETGFVAPAPSVSSIDAALERAWRGKRQWENVGKRARRLALRKIDKQPGKTLLSILLKTENTLLKDIPKNV